MNMKKLSLVFLILLLSAPNAYTLSFGEFVGGVIVGAGIAVVGAPLALGAAGFTSSGVAASSLAAGVQAGIGKILLHTWNQSLT